MLCEPEIGALSRMRAMRAATPKARRRRSKRPSGRGEEARPRICRARKASKRSLFLFFWRQQMNLPHYRRLAAFILAAAGAAACGAASAADPNLYFGAKGGVMSSDRGGYGDSWNAGGAAGRHFLDSHKGAPKSLPAPTDN